MSIRLAADGSFQKVIDDLFTDTLEVASESPAAWNSIYIGGELCPGICMPIDGERRRDVDHAKSKGGSRDLLTDNGLEPTECTIKIKTTNGAVYRLLYDFYLKYMDPNRSLSRLTIVTVSHPQLYVRGIKLGYFFAAPLPKPTSDTGDRPYIHEFRFKIVGPKTQINGAGGNGSTKPKKSPPGGPTDQLFLDTSGADKAVAFFSEQAAAPLNNVSVSPTRPANQPARLYTPIQQKSIANAGDPTARFTAGLFERSAP